MGGIAVSSLNVQGSNLKFTVDMIRASYEGTISADGILLQELGRRANLGRLSSGGRPTTHFGRTLRPTLFNL
jgi:hypothetical protein